jgi:hypothetical protein
MYSKYSEKYPRELLTEAAANSIGIAGVLRCLEIPLAGGIPAFAGSLRNKKGS